MDFLISLNQDDLLSILPSVNPQFPNSPGSCPQKQDLVTLVPVLTSASALSLVLPGCVQSYTNSGNTACILYHNGAFWPALMKDPNETSNTEIHPLPSPGGKKSRIMVSAEPRLSLRLHRSLSCLSEFLGVVTNHLGGSHHPNLCLSEVSPCVCV